MCDSSFAILIFSPALDAAAPFLEREGADADSSLGRCSLANIDSAGFIASDVQ